MVAIMLGADNGFFYAGQVMHFSSPFTVFLIYHKQAPKLIVDANLSNICIPPCTSNISHLFKVYNANQSVLAFDFGDSRIVAPKDSVLKDLIKTKGGQNSCILVDAIDIKALRDFQMLEYSMQKKDGSFKPSPPGINPDGIIQSKRKNKLKP